MHTFAVKFVGENPSIVSGNFVEGATNGKIMLNTNSQGQPEVKITPGNVEWAALYEGEYTADSLPAYRPKGYGAELAECQRYFFPFNMTLGGIITEGRTVLRVTIPLPITMRITPTISNFNASGIRHTGGASVNPTVTGARIGVYDNCVAVLYVCDELTQITNNTPIAGYFRGELSADY